jgi:hypothetical protein
VAPQQQRKVPRRTELPAEGPAGGQKNPEIGAGHKNR